MTTTNQQPSAVESEVAAPLAEEIAVATKSITSTQRVFDAVRDLRELDQIATRETVAELTGLKLSVVDDRLRALVDDGKLKRLLRGIYELVEQWPEPRTIYCGILPNGWVKMEIGEEVLTFTPSEARRASRALGGFSEDARVIESTNQHLFLATEMAAKVEALGREIRALKAAQRDPVNVLQGRLID